MAVRSYVGKWMNRRPWDSEVGPDVRLVRTKGKGKGQGSKRKSSVARLQQKARPVGVSGLFPQSSDSRFLLDRFYGWGSFAVSEGVGTEESGGLAERACESRKFELAGPVPCIPCGLAAARIATGKLRAERRARECTKALVVRVL